jgi:gliding motility-associated-like protein
MTKIVIHFFLALNLLLISSLSVAQSNPCGVQAVISPNVSDSIMYSYGPVYFQSNSINATSYRFIIGIIQYPMNSPVNFGITPGLTTVKLVAYNGNCTDTAIAYYFWSGTAPTSADNSRRIYGYPSRDQYISDLSRSDSGYLLAGNRSSWYEMREGMQGLLIKTKNGGCVEWAKKLAIDWPFGTEIKMTATGPSDATFFVGAVSTVDHLVKLNATGDIIWSMRLEDVTGKKSYINSLHPTPDGGIIVAAYLYGDSKPVLIRLNNDGSVRWSRKYDYNLENYNGFKNIRLKDNYIYVGGTAGYTSVSMIAKVDDLTGSTVWLKRYSSPNGFIILDNIISVDSTLMVGYKAPTGVTNTPIIGGFMRMDTSGNILLSKLVGETYVPNTLVGPYGGNSSLIQSGKTFYMISSGSVTLSLQPGISYLTKLTQIDSNYNVKWVQSSGGSGVPRFFYGTAAPNDGIAIGGNEIGTAMTTNTTGTFLSIKVIDSSGGNPGANCYFENQPFIVVQPVIEVQNTVWTNDVPGGIVTINAAVPLQTFYPEMKYKCPDYADSCSYLKLSGPTSICNLNDTYTIKSHKNRACGQPTQWTVPSSLQLLNQTDTSVTIKIPAFGRYIIYGKNPLSCVPTFDSIIINAATSAPPLELGQDRDLCLQNSFILHAGNKYATYLWQDGSTDSLFTVTQPGQYWVRVTDSCTNVFSDTILVSPAAPIAISAGADRQICPKDTIRIEATPGFLNYQWSPSYNISTVSNFSVLVSPLVDTSYTLVAEKTPGCFAYDTVRVSVFRVPAINLGPDLAFCNGDSAVLNADPGFANYTWSNGSHGTQLTIKSVGSYSVTGTTSDGCYARDTVRVVQVFSLPTPQLDQDPVLCVGEVKNLDPGSGYTSYLWNTGSTSQSLPVSGIGVYTVQVTDNNGCKGEAHSTINRMQNVPSSFLGPDTAICNYGIVTLKPITSYNNYLWNTGSLQPTITVTKPGLFWLEVKDDENCIGADSILVSPKECLKGLYVPGGFTPNNDGLNDLFRPRIFGDIRQYKFTVFNRWGEIIFNSTIPEHGWDGRIGGTLQNTAVFVWTCTYQLEGEPVRMEKGTFTLIR